MVWCLVQFGYQFYFQEAGYDGVTRDRIHRTIRAVRKLNDPADYENGALCPNHREKLVVRVIDDNDVLIFMKIHYDDDPDENLRHCIELVKVMNQANFT